jgi:hypothetical protein
MGSLDDKAKDNSRWIETDLSQEAKLGEMVNQEWIQFSLSFIESR